MKLRDAVICSISIFTGLMLSGCEILHNRPPPPIKVNSPKVEAYNLSVVNAPLKERSINNEFGESYKYGRFTVLVSPEGQEILGGVFKPETLLPAPTKYAHVIFINYVSKELSYYRLTKDRYEPVIGFAVVTPSADVLSQSIVRGKVTRIDTKPPWTPTANIRKKHQYLPAGTIPYGHPDNAMGEVKFEISWDVPGWSLKRIHGTKGYPEGNFQNAETFGCTRLQNDAIKNLVTLLGPNAVNEGIEVIVHKTISIE